MALIKKQKGMIRDFLEHMYGIESHPSNTYVSSFDGINYGKTSRDLWDNLHNISAWQENKDGQVSDTFSDDVMNEFGEWESSQINEVKPRGSSVWSTVGQERTKKAREEMKKIVDGFARRREKVKTKEMIF